MESTEKQILETAIQITSPLIKTLVDTYVSPKLTALNEKLKGIKTPSSIPTEADFYEYYHRTFKKLIVVNTLVFNNSQKLLPDIFIPLTVIASHDEKIKVQIEGFPKKISDEYGNILITDTAGMGKSTLMKMIFNDCLKNHHGIPIFIELRRLNKDKTIIQEILEQLNSINKTFESSVLLDLLEQGQFILILDGYDEIALSDRDIVTSNIQDFISKAPNNRYFITSRPEKALVSFGNFQEFKINPLTKKEAFELLRKYDKQGNISSLLIKKLQEKELANIEEFLTNPLLVSLLYTAFEHKQAIPFKKYLFYRQVYDANFESHDLTKGDSYTHDKYSNLEIDDFHKILRHIGFQCFKLQRIEFSKDELLKLIAESKSFYPSMSFNESDFFQDIIKTVPLFTQDGNYFRWSHKSLQEYFAAQFIYLDSKTKQNDILTRVFNHKNLDKFINILDLYYDMDYKTFRNVIEYELVKEYSDFSLKYLNNNYEGVENNEIIRRIELMFLSESFLFKATKDKNQTDAFDGPKFGDMLKKHQKKFNLEEDRFSGILVNPTLLDSIYGIHYEQVKKSIFHLLFVKKNQLISLKNEKKVEDYRVKLKHDFTEEYVMHKVSQAPDNQFNSSKNFTEINEFLEATRIFSHHINHTYATDLLKEIEETIKKESQTDFLIDGI